MLVDGNKIKESVKKEIKDTSAKLAVLLVGENKVSEKYVEIKKKFGDEIGAKVLVINYLNTSEENLIKKIKELNEDIGISGIIVQLPLPTEMDTERILNSIDPKKDVDSLSNKSSFQSPIVLAIRKIFEEVDFNYKGKNILIVGGGRLVGLPIKKFLEKEDIKPVVIDENNREDLEKEALRADVIISGVGIPSLIKSEMVKEGVFLIDAGTSFKEGRLMGDIDPNCYKKAGFYTPVPGGVGPITVAMLFRNLVDNL